MNYDDVLLTSEQSRMLFRISKFINNFVNTIAIGQESLDGLTEYIKDNKSELEEFLNPDTLKLIPSIVSSYNTYIDTMWRQYDRFDNNEM